MDTEDNLMNFNYSMLNVIECQRTFSFYIEHFEMTLEYILEYQTVVAPSSEIVKYIKCDRQLVYINLLHFSTYTSSHLIVIHS